MVIKSTLSLGLKLQDFFKVFILATLQIILARLCRALNKLGKYSLVALILFYQSTLSIFLGGRCRFEPSCSHYALEATRKHSFLFSIKLIFVRLAKCHPWGDFGYDPVPTKNGVHQNV